VYPLKWTTLYYKIRYYVELHVAQCYTALDPSVYKTRQTCAAGANCIPTISYSNRMLNCTYTYILWCTLSVVYITQRGELGQKRRRYEMWFWRVRVVLIGRGQKQKLRRRKPLQSALATRFPPSNPVFRETRPFAVRREHTNHPCNGAARKRYIYRTIVFVTAYFSMYNNI